jgi:hypothetical protein
MENSRHKIIRVSSHLGMSQARVGLNQIRHKI